VSFKDRLTGRSEEAPSGFFIPAQWVLEGPDACLVRGQVTEAGAVLIPDETGQVSGPATAGLVSDFAMVPEPDDLRTLETMGAEIRKHYGKALLAWYDVPTLMEPVSDVLDPTPLEQDLTRLIRRFEAVFAKPRAHLRLDEERQPVARCRRPSRRAISELSRRTEDWAGRKVLGIEPKRVLGLVQEESLDIYENRVAVRLVNHLDAFLVKRIRELERVWRTGLGMQRWSTRKTDSQGRGWRRADRIFRLFGAAWADQKLLRRARERRDEVRGLRRRVQSLKNTVLFRTLANRHQGLSLRSSNLFEHDDVYRAVFELWRVWEDTRRHDEIDDLTRWNTEQRAAASFFDYTVLIAIRALAVLGVEPADAALESAIEGGMRLPLNGRLGATCLAFDNDLSEIKILGRNDETLIRVLALPARLHTSRKAQDADFLKSVGGLPAQEPTIVAYLGDLDPQVLSQIPQALHGPGPVVSTLSWVPLAPWEVESVETLARALRWHLTHTQFARYPPMVDVVRSLATTLPRWLMRRDEEHVITTPPNKKWGATAWPALDAAIARSSTHKLDLVSQIDAASANRDKASKTRLKQSLSEVDGEWAALMRTQETLTQGMQLFEDLSRCPMCKASDVDFRGDDGQDFKVHCKGCDCKWGARSCPSCHERFPWMTPADNTTDFEPKRINAAFGSDVVAFPSHTDGYYLCTHCGKPTDGPRHESPNES